MGKEENEAGEASEAGLSVPNLAPPLLPPTLIDKSCGPLGSLGL